MMWSNLENSAPWKVGGVILVFGSVFGFQANEQFGGWAGPIAFVLFMYWVVQRGQRRLTCPHCGEDVMARANVCPHCTRNIYEAT